MSVQQITEDIYANTAYDGGNVACIRTEKGMVLVDTPTFPRDIEDWRQFLSGLDPRGPRYIIVTHQHFDHVMGNHRIGGVGIAHHHTREEMAKEGGTGRETLARGMPGISEEDMNFLLSEPLALPEILMTEELTLDLGNHTIRLIHLGGHTSGSICAYVEEERVLIAGDNVTAGLHPFKGLANFREWIGALKEMKSMDVRTIVPGHGELCGPGELDTLLEYFHRLWFLTEASIKRGLPRQETVAEVHRAMIDYYEIDPERLERSKFVFDMGTNRLYDEILGIG